MTDYTDLIARGVTVWTLDGEYDMWSMQHPTDRSKDEYDGQWVKADEAAAAIAALTAERDALQAHIAQEAEFLATVTAAKHEAEREVERLRNIADIALYGWQFWVDDQHSGASNYDEMRGEIDAVRSSITARF